MMPQNAEATIISTTPISPFVFPPIKPPKMIAGAMQAKNKKSVDATHLVFKPSAKSLT